MPAARRYSDELREQAVRLVSKVREQTGKHRGAIAWVGGRLGINPGTLRRWVVQAEVDNGKRSGLSTGDRKRIAELERELRELRRAELRAGTHC